MTDGATITAIIGPSGGIAVPASEELELLARACATLAEDVVGWVGLGARVLADADLIASSPLSPVTFAEAETAVLEATVGPQGLSETRWALTAVAEGVRLFSAAFPEVDLAIARRFAARAAVLYGPETGVAVSAVTAPSPPPPSGLPTLLSDLESVAHEAPGTIAVETITATDGSRRHVVLLPGTNDMLTLPGGRDADLRDMDENFRLVAGENTAYVAGVLDAFAQAGVQPGEPILIAGHSQGGMVAVALAAAAAGLGYRVTQIVTAGAPAPAEAPAGTSVLALENSGDIVPLTDGTIGSSMPGQLTVQFDSGSHGIVDSHHLDHYVEGADAAETFPDPTLQHTVSVIDAYLDPSDATVTTQTFVLTRD